jgi:DNA-binding transcriptional ArsR family regulator
MGEQRRTSAGKNVVDKRTLRALAHPLRVQLMELLRLDGPATASGLAARVGESSGTTSWHLRQLAAGGLVEEDTSLGTRRERWWRAAHESQRVRTADFLDDPDAAGALNTYLQSIVHRRHAAEAQFVAELSQWKDRWTDKISFSDHHLHLTPEEAIALSNEVEALIERYRREPRDGDDIVVAHWAAFPRQAHPEQS